MGVEVSDPRAVCWMIDGRGDGLHGASRTTFEDYIPIGYSIKLL